MVAQRLPRLRQLAAAGALRHTIEEYETRLEALPGVAAVASASELPAAGMNQNVLAIENVTLSIKSREAAIDALLVGLVVSRRELTDVIDVAFVAEDPRRAQRIAISPVPVQRSRISRPGRAPARRTAAS